MKAGYGPGVTTIVCNQVIVFVTSAGMITFVCHRMNMHIDVHTTRYFLFGKMSI